MSSNAAAGTLNTVTPPNTAGPVGPDPTDSPAAWLRLGLVGALSTIGGVGMWSVVVVLPVVQPEFGATRGDVSLAATMVFFGFGLGGVITGKITDRVGTVVARVVSIIVLGSA